MQQEVFGGVVHPTIMVTEASVLFLTDGKCTDPYATSTNGIDVLDFQYNGSVINGVS